MGSLRRAVLTAVSLAAPLLVTAQTPDDFAQDFETMWRRTTSMYAYFDTKATAWADVPGLYADDLRRVKTRDEFVMLLEQVLDELYDPHTQLNTNSAASYRLVPSGADLWAEWRGGRAVITDVRADSDAQRAGIRPNDVVVSINASSITAAVDERVGRSYSRAVANARDWALRSVLAGRHDRPRRLEIRRGDAVRMVELAARDQFATSGREPVRHSQAAPGVGYIRINDRWARCRRSSGSIARSENCAVPGA